MTAMTYPRYLHLAELLSLQHPLTAPLEQDLHDNERLFISVHQMSELLLSQVLVDLRHIKENRCTARCFAHRADRATLMVESLEAHLTLLRETLRPEAFLMFRDRFGSASGLQSAQFQELFRLTDRLETRESSLPLEPHRLARLRTAITHWRRTHLGLVKYMIGDLPGSGDTDGVRFLAKRLAGSSLDDTARHPRTDSEKVRSEHGVS
ncbi:tryptophan 2,3-dioxygenase family protein [Actinoalloteichus hymeniacidonis]|uniref:Tryptophan 2,3-dioxygenase n=1 Tax=Actinoalloteichus hymeniacidonis TaxID=340345 RepID=A0AAC9N015_9PSEU|nr:tryptophan 2,3-dioxygenase family protein [Actinoalloteichus hymeniacidonis]AOS64501.1 Tryptophan 2,3-dioxygenase [Actinoalloteichus hymeniacidonis]MBB5907428.1 tryptophan 2,3-dioxygenase [Actinoalloteichus hymeniacidonis]